MSSPDRGRSVPASGERVVVLGLGLSGEAATRRLLERGAEVTVFDAADDPIVRHRSASLAGATVVLGHRGVPDFRGVNLVIASPGVPIGAPVVVAAREHGIPVWSEVELAFRLARAPILGVTGTNGKTTTTRMLSDALGSAGWRACAAGNIGQPLCDAVVEDYDVIVAELSSFQLETIVSFRARVAVLLNVAEDHLDWHGSMDRYARAKSRIFENQSFDDHAVFSEECEPWVRGPATHVPFSTSRLPAKGAGIENGVIVVPQGPVLEVRRLRASGGPNVANAIAAAAAACAFGADPLIVGDALAEFAPLPHRMEVVADLGGVVYIDDSKATNPHATLSAMDGLERVVLIAGGRNKGLDLSTLAGASPHLRGVVAIGEAAGEIESALTGHVSAIERAATMDEAVERASAMAARGDTVLLSPACASFDMFTDYKARGDAFKVAVQRLTTKVRGGLMR
jgi:UDP-N-acetylmuramoylalanine--D-glutamate ligase